MLEIEAIGDRVELRILRRVVEGEKIRQQCLRDTPGGPRCAGRVTGERMKTGSAPRASIAVLSLVSMARHGRRSGRLLLRLPLGLPGDHLAVAREVVEKVLPSSELFLVPAISRTARSHRHRVRDLPCQPVAQFRGIPNCEPRCRRRPTPSRSRRKAPVCRAVIVMPGPVFEPSQ